MKKFFKVLLVIILIGIIGFLGFSLYGKNVALKTAHSQIESMSFKEGAVVENEKGGTVTVNLNTWIYFQDDSFVTETKPTGVPVKEIFCDLHKANQIDSFKDNLAKVKYSKQIIVNVGEGKPQQIYYLVGDYYIAEK